MPAHAHVEVARSVGKAHDPLTCPKCQTALALAGVFLAIVMVWAVWTLVAFARQCWRER